MINNPIEKKKTQKIKTIFCLKEEHWIQHKYS